MQPDDDAVTAAAQPRDRAAENSLSIASGGAARPQLLRALNGQLILEHIRQRGPCTRAELARVTGLSKPTVSLALSKAERGGLVREAGQRTGVPGRSALLYEVRPSAGYVLGLHAGHRHLRGAAMDMMQTVLARSQVRVTARGTAGRLRELAELADEICRAAGIARSAVTQTVLGSPGVYDPRNAIAPADSVTGSAEARVLAQLRATFGADLVVENDVDAATLAEQEYGAGVQRSTFAFIWIGTGVGMGLVVDGRLHRGAHGAAGEIGSMPISAGTLEGAGSASAIVRAARTVGMRGRVSARRVFAAAAAGDGMAADVVAAHAELLARAVCAIVTIVDPELVVLGGGIGRAPGLASSMAAELVKLTPVMPQVQVSAMGAEAVVRGCLAVGHELAWQRLTATLQ